MQVAFSVVELCAGGGGQALGLEAAGFEHAAVVEYEPGYCATLRANRPHWNTLQMDIRHVRAQDFRGVDLIAAGVPCPPFSIAGRQLGGDDERDMFPHALSIIEVAKPTAILIENVAGLASAKFSEYRDRVLVRLQQAGYETDWRVIQSSDYGAPQLRPRFALLGWRRRNGARIEWPKPGMGAPTVGEALRDLMGVNGWLGAEAWCAHANRIAPTIVGGSKKHGGPDLGPTRAKAQWRELGVDGMGIANAAPGREFAKNGLPRLTIPMVARLQTFPDDWKFQGGKTAAYRQIGNAFPPKVAASLGIMIARYLRGERSKIVRPSGSELAAS